jgi:hypothetical protein
MSILVLPNELLDKIFDNLETVADVISMRKAHRHFQSSARRLILRDVYLPLDTDLRLSLSHVLANFVDAVRNDKEIVPFVRTITLTYKCGRADLYFEDLLESLSWIKGRYLEILLAEIPFLEKLSLLLDSSTAMTSLDGEILAMLYDM